MFARSSSRLNASTSTVSSTSSFGADHAPGAFEFRAAAPSRPREFRIAFDLAEQEPELSVDAVGVVDDVLPVLRLGGHARIELVDLAGELTSPRRRWSRRGVPSWCDRRCPAPAS